ncbi:MAG: hypothetical protein ACXAEU_08355 [Candidatus Hodarchaeales archaeon]
MKSTLTEPEKEFLAIYAGLFAIHGRSKNFGRIFALLNLKARSPDTGLDQKQIAAYITQNFTPVDVSTVSRILKKMEQQSFCNFKEEKHPHSNRNRHRYFAKTSFKDLLIGRLHASIKEANGMIGELDKLKGKVSDDETSKNQDLLELVYYLERLYNLSVKLYNKFAVMTAEEFQDL